MEWLRDGNTILTGNGSQLILRLLIPSVAMSDAGVYTCMALVVDASSTEPVVVGPVSAGTLTVLGKYIRNYCT